MRQAIVKIGSLLRWEKEFSRAVLRLSVPVSIQSLIVALMHIVDNLMISELGEFYLAGVSQANRITFLMQMTMFGLVSGASVFTAQFWGAKDIKGIHETLGIGMLTGILGALVFAIRMAQQFDLLIFTRQSLADLESIVRRAVLNQQHFRSLWLYQGAFNRLAYESRGVVNRDYHGNVKFTHSISTNRCE